MSLHSLLQSTCANIIAILTSCHGEVLHLGFTRASLCAVHCQNLVHLQPLFQAQQTIVKVGIARLPHRSEMRARQKISQHSLEDMNTCLLYKRLCKGKYDMENSRRALGRDKVLDRAESPGRSLLWLRQDCHLPSHSEWPERTFKCTTALLILLGSSTPSQAKVSLFLHMDQQCVQYQHCLKQRECSHHPGFRRPLWPSISVELM